MEAQRRGKAVPTRTLRSRFRRLSMAAYSFWAQGLPAAARSYMML